ncbi:MAG: hypothetical protein OIN88_01735 [Candidatus Methanoperedens sp.]|nr:hypothetical protein [Candidatus Methanoperedens sp.]HLB70229.1 hypothetical protein [Candidatus Methanoperedens sp.]
MLILDSSSIILLAKVRLLEKFLTGKQAVIPLSVYNESVIRGKDKGREDAYLIEALVKNGKIKVSEPNKPTCKEVGSLFNLHGGERDVLALAKDMNIKCIICDDKKAINACKILELKFITALNVIIAMCLKGKISKEEAEKQIDMLDELGWYNIRIIKKARQDIDA